MAQGLGGLGRAIGTIIDVRRERKRKERLQTAVSGLISEASEEMVNNPNFSYKDFYVHAVRRGVAQDPRVVEYAKLIQQKDKAAAPRQRQAGVGELARRSTVEQPGTPDVPILPGGGVGEAPPGAPQMKLFGDPGQSAAKTREEGLQRAAELQAEGIGPPGVTTEELGATPSISALPPQKSLDVQKRHEERIDLRKAQMDATHERWRADSARTQDKNARKNQDSNIMFIINHQKEAEERLSRAEKGLAGVEVKASDPSNLADYTASIKTYKDEMEKAQSEIDAWAGVGDMASQTGGAVMTAQQIREAFKAKMAGVIPGQGAPAMGGLGGTPQQSKYRILNVE